jgi:hypothetical protein
MPIAVLLFSYYIAHDALSDGPVPPQVRPVIS